MRSFRGSSLVLTALVVACALAGTASADATHDEFDAGVAALDRGAFGDAIDHFELLADRGFVHPDASFDRAVAYLGRARSPQKQPGDLGRAAAALAETLALRPDDRQAESALDAVRSEIGRQRARTGASPLVARPRLVRALVGLLPEQAWGVLGALGSASLAWGLALRLFVKRVTTEVPGALAIGIGALLLCSGGGLALGARHFRRTSTLAVVVVPEARLLDDAGRPLPVTTNGDGNVVPEGAEVYVLERHGGLDRVEWGSTDGYVVAGQVREVEAPAADRR
ncbi:MAG TPA: hypothetical protein VMI54_13425 [Polyangiaceae bacterium]|nr:hypothetical protein [Polyangiaceae bacterium]